MLRRARRFVRFKAALVLGVAFAAGCQPPPPARPTLEATVRITESATGLTLVTERPDAEVFPIVSRDGKRVFFQASQLAPSQGTTYGQGFWDDLTGQRLLNWELWSCNADGSGGSTRITNYEWYDGTPCPLPDGDILVFSAYRMGSLGFWSIKNDGTGGSRQIRVFTGLVDRPMVAPDGKKIIFGHSTTSNWREGFIWTCNIDGGELTQMISGLQPCWSPDGTRVAFIRYSSGAEKTDIWIMNADGSNVTQVSASANGSYPFYPVWSPDAAWLAFHMSTTSNSSSRDIYMMKSDGSGLTQLTASLGNEANAWWAPDGSIFFAAETLGEGGTGKNWNIWKLKPIVNR